MKVCVYKVNYMCLENECVARKQSLCVGKGAGVRPREPQGPDDPGASEFEWFYPELYP